MRLAVRPRSCARVGDPQVAAGDRLHAFRARSLVEAHEPEEIREVGQRDRGLPVAGRGLDRLIDAHHPVGDRVLRVQSQVNEARIGRSAGYHPGILEPVSSRGSRRRSQHLMQRRQFHRIVTALAATVALPSTTSSANNIDSCAALERRSGGRLGVALLDTRSGRFDGYRQHERFPMCSTFKMLAAAFVLRRVDQGAERLERKVRFTQSDLVPYSPITEKQIDGDGMTVAALCEAAITVSDNTAGNLLLASFGGPAGLTAFARQIGDPMTRLDRNEPSLNEATPGDDRDTTTPRAMLGNLQTLLLGDPLTPASRGRLEAWLMATRTGGRRLRALLPVDWRVGDKTGTGERGTSNDIAIVRPPGRAPLLAAVYLTGSRGSADLRDETIAMVGARLTTWS